MSGTSMRVSSRKSSFDVLPPRLRRRWMTSTTNELKPSGTDASSAKSLDPRHMIVAESALMFRQDGEELADQNAKKGPRLRAFSLLD